MSKNVHVLIHGQIYTMSEDELMHWKYIKREKQPDGSYKYYYDTSEEDNAWKNSKKAEYEATKAGGKMGAAQLKAQEAYNKWRNSAPYGAALDIKQAKELKKERDKLYEEYLKAQKEADEATAAYKAAKKKAEKTVNKYKAQKIGNFLNKTVSKGITAVTQLLTSIFTGNKNAVIEKRKSNNVIYNNDFSDVSDDSNNKTKKTRTGR